MHNIYTLLRECKRECLESGIYIGEIADISVNTRAEKRWGYCKYEPIEDAYYIQISYKLVDDETPVKTLKETILHELCHTIEGGMCHTGEWKHAVTILNRNYGYNIKRTNSYEDKGVSREKFPPKQKRVNYVFECCGCGNQIRRQKRSDFVTNTHRYRCGGCGNKFKQIF
jgi:predicted SprT family Zn-dependent metalloprotease